MSVQACRNTGSSDNLLSVQLFCTATVLWFEVMEPRGCAVALMLMSSAGQAGAALLNCLMVKLSVSVCFLKVRDV